jgi:hypothetical protein
MEYMPCEEEPCAIMQEEQHWDEMRGGKRERNKVICKSKENTAPKPSVK